ncbi:MAG: MFS transporter [Opitutae bacterium]|nr:MFS transporter [Opitutae bacterium]
MCNVARPTAIMSWCGGDKLLGPKWGLLVALLLPLGYGIHDFARRRRTKFISVIGFVSVLISGGLGLMKLDGFGFAVKDGALPALIGVAMLASMCTKEPLVHEMLYNTQVIDVDRVEAALNARNAQGEFKRLMNAASYLLVASFLVSAILNCGFARAIIRSAPGTEAFNGELAKMHWVSLLGISIPSIAMMMWALWRLLKGSQNATGLTLDEILKSPPEKKTGPTPPEG